MDDLIARLEAATGPSRELDADIAREALGAYVAAARMSFELDDAPRPIPPFTASIDAARTLVIGLWSLHCEDGPAHARVLPPNARGDFIGQDYAVADAETPALALCIAALKARARRAEGA